jgi:hypothetical protein
MGLRGSGAILKGNLPVKVELEKKDCLFIWLNMYGDTTIDI